MALVTTQLSAFVFFQNDQNGPSSSLAMIPEASTLSTMITSSSSPPDDAISTPLLNAGSVVGKKAIPSNNVTEPSEMSLDMKDALFLHIGKAGGGFVKERLKQWKLNITRCHPWPCSSRDSTAGALVNIRDPVDRFVSAFYWRAMILCNPDGDQRQKLTPSAGAPPNTVEQHPDRFCKDSNQRGEKNALFRLYKQNATMFAESLCSRNNRTSKEARRFLHEKLHHARHSIRAWNSLAPPEKHVFIVVSEASSGIASLEDQVDDYVEWLHGRLKFESDESFQNRKAFVKQQGVNRDETILHSSQQDRRHGFPQEAVECVAANYRKDYELLSSRMESLCKTDVCLTGIRSIIQRRSFLLTKNNTVGVPSQPSVN